jgi:hypothetical protein
VAEEEEKGSEGGRGRMKIVWVKWRDANQYLRQSSIEDVRQGLCEIVETVGFLIKDDSDSLIVANEYMGTSGDVRRTIVIPKENVVKMKLLKA